MNAAIVYYSQSGQTRKVADAIAAEARTTPIPLAEAETLPQADVVFVGMPVERFGPPAAACEHLDRLCGGRRVALFATHAAEEGTPGLETWLAACRDAVTAAGGEVTAQFDCQAELAEPVKRMMLASGMPALVTWAEGDHSQGQPDDERLDRAREFAREVLATHL
jgi:flavodoxin